MLAIVNYYLLLGFLWATFGLWLSAIFWTHRQLKELRPLRYNNLCLADQENPRVSVLLPARNEEKRILNRCVNSLLAQTYQNFEIIAVNDRSTDCTGEILRRVAKTDARLQVIEGSELPAGWLGKPYVLQQAVEKSTADWIISTDADIVFAPNAVETAVAYAEKNNFDALCLIPFDVCETFWEKIFLPAFSWFRMLKMPPSRVNNPQRSESMGVGNFFLIRRIALEKINGFESVKAEVAEDLRLAQLLKKSGWHFRLDYAPDLLQTRMYANLPEIWAGFTKNLFAAANFSVGKTISGAGSILLFGVLPVVFGFYLLMMWLTTKSVVVAWLLVPAILIYICQTIVFAALNHFFKQPLKYAFLAALGLGMFAAILINSALKISTGRGVMWKGRVIYQRGEQSSKRILENE